MIEAAYNLEELEILCADMKIRYENLGGMTLRAKIYHLVDYCQRHRMYDRLVQTVLKDRPI